MRKATREQTKAHNQTLILNTIYSTENLSRADVARLTGLTRTTVSDIVAELMQDGLVEEVGLGQSSGGKPPILLAVNSDARTIIGIDLASDEFRGAIINLRGEIKHRIHLPIEDNSGEGALALVYELIDKLLEKDPGNIAGIGIGAPGLIDAKQGVIRNAVNLEWEDLPLADMLQKKYRLPAYIANDSQLSALAEFAFGGHSDISNLVLVKIGRGVGSGIVLDQQLYHGEAFGAGEFGHVRVEEGGELCACGNYGCLETRISSRAIRCKAREIAKADANSILAKTYAENNRISILDVVAAHEAGEKPVLELVEQVSADLGKALSFLISVLNVRTVVLAGSVSDFDQALIEPVVEYLNTSVLTVICEDTNIIASRLGDEIVMLGAAAITLQKELGIV